MAAPKPWESASLAVLRPRSLGRPRRLGRRPRHLALLSPLARVLDHLLALGGGRAAPLLAQYLAPRRRQLLELVEILPHPGLLVRRQFLEFLPAAAQPMALLGRQPLPVRKSCVRSFTRLLRQAQPSFVALLSACSHA